MEGMFVGRGLLFKNRLCSTSLTSATTGFLCHAVLLLHVQLHLRFPPWWLLGKLSILLFHPVMKRTIRSHIQLCPYTIVHNYVAMKLYKICLSVFRFLESHWFVWATQISHIPMNIDLDRKKDWVSMQVLRTIFSL